MRARWEGRRFPSPMTCLVAAWGAAITAATYALNWLLW